MEEKKDVEILYICDRKACGDACPNPECMYTKNILHALSFRGMDLNGKKIYIQR